MSVTIRLERGGKLESQVAFGHDPLSAVLNLFLFDDGQAALVHEGTGSCRERQDPVVDVFRILQHEGQGYRSVATLLPHEEALIPVALDSGVPKVENTQRSTDLLLRVNDGEVLDTRAVNLDLDGLTMIAARAQKRHVAAHVLGVPAGIDVRLVAAALVEVQEIGVHSHVGRHLDVAVQLRD